uniref:radical SAM/SPASM domain-containing protein n=1 Tax=Streptosporangium sp. CA-235898 TaxID=3240073 RepID=UPI003F491B4C
MTALQHETRPTDPSPLRFLWLEVTGRCQLTCSHCYADSSPAGTDGTMAPPDWAGVIDQAAALGVQLVQLIGGEPTLYRPLPDLIGRALTAGMEVEVYSNLVHVTPTLWEAFSRPGVRLATSFYTDDPVEHMRITGRNTLPRTRLNIEEALARSIPLRVGMVHVNDGQRITEAKTLLADLGVTRIGTDRLRVLGRPSRGVSGQTSELCGACGGGKAAIGADGSVWPCVMARWMRAGNVLEDPLAEIVNSPTWHRLVSTIPAPRMGEGCKPEDNMCNPTAGDGSDCAPSEREACNPSFCNPD